jgi:hypothetical protein
MSVKIDINTNASQIAAGLAKFPRALADAIGATMKRQNQILVAYIQRNKLSGSGPNSVGVKSGTLRKSVNATDPSISESEVSSQIGTSVLYAIFQEAGTKPYTIVPKRASVLSFMVGGERVFAKKVKHPGLRARKMFETALREKQPDYNQALLQAVDEGWEKVWANV